MSHISIVRPARMLSPVKKIKSGRIASIDLLRGIVMIIMAIDHTRDYFHNTAFIYNPEDLNHTSIILFFTRWITHFCAPVFVFLSGLSAYLYGAKKTRKELSFFLFTRGMWLIFAELFILSLFRTFNPAYHFFNLQVIWAIGICMIALSAMIYMRRALIAVIGLLLIFGHNLLDNIHVAGAGLPSFLWALLHDPGYFTFGRYTFHVHYPVLPWIGIMATGYCFGNLYAFGYRPEKRRIILLSLGISSIICFFVLRLTNIYGDPSPWSVQTNISFTILSFFNVTKYPPSLLYTLMTLGPALIFLATSEGLLNALTERISVFGRVPMFYYLVHILLIHSFATIGAAILGYKWSDMVLSTMVNRTTALKGYGFSLLIVYLVWSLLILVLYPLCKRFDHYKRKHRSTQWWLSYL